MALRLAEKLDLNKDADNPDFVASRKWYGVALVCFCLSAYMTLRSYPKVQRVCKALGLENQDQQIQQVPLGEEGEI